ncbi:BamA/TamA family outer membrane protein [candidate division WOR-3 bacterium]|nr:BamA/TamA family outer membrane protein [candidate division WOR-3 bacterium]
MNTLLFISCLLVIEGFRVERVNFYGNNTFSNKVLKEIIHTRKGKLYDEFQASLDEKRLISFYRNKGFKEAKVISWKRSVIDFEKKRIKYSIYIEEGRRTCIKEIKFEGNKVFPSTKLNHIIKLKPDDPLDEELIFMAEYAIMTFYTERGYAYAEVKHNIVNITPYETILCFQINEHHLIWFGNIKIEGQKAVRNAIIMREITFKKGSLYSHKKLSESQARIYGTNLFESVNFKLQGIGENRDTLDVIFSVKEGLPRWLAFGSGYISSARIWFNIGWGHDNLWNNGQKLELQSKYELNPFDLEELQKGEITISYMEPYFLNTPLKAQIKPFYKFYKVDKKPCYWLTYLGAEGRLGKYIGKFGQSFISYNYEVIRKGGNVPVYEVGGIVNSFLFSIAWDTRDNVFYPRKGGISAFSYEYSGGFLGGDYRFKKFTLDLLYFTTFFESTIGTRLKFGNIVDESPLERRFILGGINTIRGYQDMSYEPFLEWGNCIELINLELRIPVFKKLEFAYFIDAGNIGLKLKNMSIKNIKLGTGFGLRYYTPIGPLRLDYGRKLINPGNDRGRLYVGIGYMF